MEANRRQIVMLGGILVLLAAVLYWQSTRTEPTPAEFSAAMSQKPSGPPGLGDAAPTAGPPRAVAAGPATIPAVQLASLDRPQPEPSDTGRDPFRFESAPAAGGGGKPAGPVTAPPPPPAMPIAPQEPPGPPPILLKFIGIAKQGQGRLIAVLRDDRGIYYGTEGDVVEGRYRILRVSADTVEVSYVDGRGRVRIPLSGGRP